ncbi:MAG TPA: protein kinase, partial [Thermoanaerobaculia bacterium]
MSIAIEPGSTLAHYRVIAPLGAGGMGEVYKAQDLTLDRTLALKILPPELVRNDERVRRFMQEARSASSLNHPNIITIYEIGQADSIHYIAMELIDGATLSRKIHASDADLRTLLEYLAQAAEGLAKAHAAGIVHRDLKPENIMVTRDGYAKVLDFGLAKLSTKRSPDPTNESTIARDNTREGTLLGTVAYMSPEQAQGKPLDHRSDIFSFGAILYEAATKRRPFEADSDIDILHKIVHDKPPAIDEIDPSVPAELRRLIRRCLAKDPEKRHQSMKNLSLELMEIVEEFEELSASATSASRSHSGPIAAPKRNRWIAPAAIVAALAIAGVAAWQWPRGAVATATAPPAFARMQITPLTTSGNVTDAAISPDGRYVAHIVLDGSRFSLRVRQVATGSDVEIIPQGELPLYYVSFSRDGDYIYYVQYDNPAGSGYGTLFRIPALGGPARKIIFDVDTKVSESPDMKQITFVRGAPVTSKNHLFVANADGTGAKIIETSVRVGPPLNPAWSPDGKTIILPRMTVAGDSRAEIAAIDPTSGSKRILRQRWEQPGSVAWLSDGSAFVTTPAATNSDFQQVWLQPFPDGEPVRITNDLNRYFDVSVTADGKTLAAVQAEQDVELSIVDGATKRPFTDRMGNTRRPLHFGVARSGAVVTDLDTSEGANIAIIDAPGAAP